MDPSQCPDGDCEMLILYAVPFIVAGLWMFFCALFSNLSGWDKLATQYRVPDGVPDGKYLNHQSGKIGRGYHIIYRGCIQLTFTPLGLGITMSSVFRFRHPPIFIPWGEIDLTEGVHDEKYTRGIKSAQLRLRLTNEELVFWDERAVRAIFAEHGNFHGKRRQ